MHVGVSQVGYVLIVLVAASARGGGIATAGRLAFGAVAIPVRLGEIVSCGRSA